MEKQVIVAVAREFGSGGHEIAQKLADELGFAFYDRKMLDEIAEEKEIEVGYLEKYDEKPRNLFLSRRVGAYSNSMEEIIADMQFDFLRKKADEGGSFVVVGRCAETILKDREGLISVFILGDEDVKAKRVSELYHLSRRETLMKMKRHDQRRKMYHNRHSDVKWGDSRGYDLCINSSRLGVEKTADELLHYIRTRMEQDRI